ncbi:hypothetical protein ACTFIR_003772 [Dictyostelium discoideum]
MTKSVSKKKKGKYLPIFRIHNTDLPNLEISNLVSDDSSTSSSSSWSHVSSNTGNIPRSIDQTISRVNTNPNSTTLETGDYSTFQSHVYSSSYTRFRNFCTSNSLNPANITLVVFMDYLTHLFKHKPPLAFSTINGHRSMLNQLLLLKNQTDIVNDPFITRIMTGIHKLRPSSAKYQEIWDANQIFRHLSTIKVITKYTNTALLKKTLVLCKMFCLARSSDLVKWSFNGLIITPDSIKSPVINAKEQRKGVLSILELTSLDDTNSQVCPVRHLSDFSPMILLSLVDEAIVKCFREYRKVGIKAKKDLLRRHLFFYEKLHLIKNIDENSIIDHIYHHALKEYQFEKIAQALLFSYLTEHNRLPASQETIGRRECAVLCRRASYLTYTKNGYYKKTHQRGNNRLKRGGHSSSLFRA